MVVLSFCNCAKASLPSKNYEQFYVKNEAYNSSYNSGKSCAFLPDASYFRDIMFSVSLNKMCINSPFSYGDN